MLLLLIKITKGFGHPILNGSLNNKDQLRKTNLSLVNLYRSVMSTLLAGSNRPEDSIYGTNEKEVTLFFTFFFVLFFVQFGRQMLLNESINSYNVIVMTVLIMIWYGTSLMLSD